MCCRTRSLELSNFNPKRGDRNNGISRWTTRRVEFLIVSKVEKKRKPLKTLRKNGSATHCRSIWGAIYKRKEASLKSRWIIFKMDEVKKGIRHGVWAIWNGKQMDRLRSAGTKWMDGRNSSLRRLYILCCAGILCILHHWLQLTQWKERLHFINFFLKVISLESWLNATQKTLKWRLSLHHRLRLSR